ncbi:MAG: S8 family peptidase [Woeseiaceae bacterium]|nr:S8 family peptidase [Woeseiaceae bacterium]
MAAKKRTTKRKTKKKVSKKKARKKRVARRRSDEPLIVYIHGIGAHPPKERFKAEWDLSLFGCDMGDRTRMAYWADILHSSKPGKKAASVADTPQSLDPATLLAEINVDPEDERALRTVQALADYLAADGGQAMPQGEGPGAKALPLPRFLRRPIAERLLRWFVKDTAAYFFDQNVRKRIKQRLIEQLPTSGQPFVLVSHSQGTIVAFEVLSELSRRAEVELFATMGSPLGIREVQDLIEESGFALEIPEDVRSWHNFADRLDPVALDAGLKSDFEPRGTITDHMVVNDRTKDLLRFNPHSSVGYLANNTVRSVIHHAYGFDSAGRFVVARDVAEGFAGVGVRQPVLIEALHPGYYALGETYGELAKREKAQPETLASLTGRIESLADSVRKEVRERAALEGADPDDAEEAARVMPLRKFVSARLTSDEIQTLACRPAELNVYAVWRSAEKQKLISRSLAPIKVDAARASYGAEGADITWAVLDTGARFDHPHFAGNDTIIEVLNCTTADPAPVPITSAGDADRDGHGTHVAGIIAGEADDENGRRMRGIAPRTRLLVYKVLDDNGFGEDAWIIKAIDDIYRRNDTGTGLRIYGANLSLGGPFDATVYGCGYTPICQELRDIWRQGVLVCVAAGNEGQVRVQTNFGETNLNTQISIGDPANLDDCIAVGSVNADKPHLYGISYFSSRGPTADGRLKPDVVAPGERIRSANAAMRPSGRDLYLAASGTSMACPHVSGMLAAFLSVRREFIGRPDEVKEILLKNCNDLGRDRYHQGAGLPNLMKMLLNT